MECMSSETKHFLSQEEEFEHKLFPLLYWLYIACHCVLVKLLCIRRWYRRDDASCLFFSSHSNWVIVTEWEWPIRADLCIQYKACLSPMFLLLTSVCFDDIFHFTSIHLLASSVCLVCFCTSHSFLWRSLRHLKQRVCLSVCFHFFFKPVCPRVSAPHVLTSCIIYITSCLILACIHTYTNIDLETHWEPAVPHLFPADSNSACLCVCLSRQLLHNSNLSSSNGSTEDLFRDSIDSCDIDIIEKAWPCLCLYVNLILYCWWQGLTAFTVFVVTSDT